MPLPLYFTHVCLCVDLVFVLLLNRQGSALVLVLSSEEKNSVKLVNQVFDHFYDRHGYMKKFNNHQIILFVPDINFFFSKL